MLDKKEEIALQILMALVYFLVMFLLVFIYEEFIAKPI